MISFREFLLLENKPKITINDDLSVDVAGDVSLYDQNLDVIPVQFGKVSGNFWCDYNNLTSLVGAPKEVGRNFDCGANKLNSIEGAPKEVSGYFSCSGNNLTSLEGAPKVVGGDFSCNGNKLTSLVGAPKEVGRNFSCRSNHTKFTEEDVRKVSNVGKSIYV